MERLIEHDVTLSDGPLRLRPMTELDGRPISAKGRSECDMILTRQSWEKKRQKR